MVKEDLYNARQLLHQVAQGDEQAFARLFEENWRNVYGHVLTYTKAADKAEEITQDIFLKIWQQRERLTEVENFTSYIFILGRNQVISAMRKKLANHSDVEAAGILEEDTLVPDRQLHYKETYGFLLRAIEQMPPIRQQVFKLSRFEDMTHEAIASQLGIARNTVKQHIVLALNFLRKYAHEHPEVFVFLLIYFRDK